MVKRLRKKIYPILSRGRVDIKGFKWGELIFSPEDENKLQQMKGREGIEYVKKLISEGKYKFGEAK